jgi:hypothetical protein
MPHYRTAAKRFAVKACAKIPTVLRNADSFARIERRGPTIDHFLVVPPALLDGLPEAARDQSRGISFCSQNHALQLLGVLKPTHIFPEARLHELSTLDEAMRTQIADDFADYPQRSVTPPQMEHLMLRAVADIYAAMSGVRIKSSISHENAARSANEIDRYMKTFQRDAAAGTKPKPFPLHVIYDHPAEDMARRIEHLLGAADASAAKVAVVSQYPFALAAHLNPYVTVREHDCTLPFLDGAAADQMEGDRRRILTSAIERKLKSAAP